jgi:hypothetical protein
MAQIEIEGQVFEVDGDGFLTNPEIWNDEVAPDVCPVRRHRTDDRQALVSGADHSSQLRREGDGPHGTGNLQRDWFEIA